MLLPDDRCPAEYRRADRNGFCPTALEDWIAAAERARVGIHRRKGSDRYNFAKFRDAPGHACAVIVQEGGNVISVSILSADFHDWPQFNSHLDSLADRAKQLREIGL
ncbi:MAG: hypothetical protein OXG04_07260 [Acidobacteria bacterium]|nr:hypothetical protein [Acidobacteriota bacterium]